MNGDNKLIKRVLEGDNKAFRTLYDLYYRNHYLTCRRYLRNESDAKDVLQESYIQIYKSLKNYNAAQSKYLTWSNRLVVNCCLMHLRKRNILTAFENVRELMSNLQVKESVIDQLNLQDLTKVISHLPAGYRTVFNMYVIDGYSHKEIAEQLGISVSTSKTQLHKAKKTLQGMIDHSLNNSNSEYVFG